MTDLANMTQDELEQWLVEDCDCYQCRRPPNELTQTPFLKKLSTVVWIDFENEAVFKGDCEEINEHRPCTHCSFLAINEPICEGQVTHTYGVGGGYAGLCEAHYKALPSRDCLSEDYEEWRRTS